MKLLLVRISNKETSGFIGGDNIDDDISFIISITIENDMHTGDNIRNLVYFNISIIII